MKLILVRKITISLVLLCLLFAYTSISFLPTLGEEKSNLVMNKSIGISEDVGTFRCINAPIMTNLNFYKQGMAFDSKGNLYITDSGESQIEVFDSNLKPLRHFGGIGNKPGQFQYLVDLTISQDEIFALDLTLGKVQVFDLEGNILYQFSTKVESDKTSSHPIGLTISLDTNIFVIDLFNGLKVFKRDGTFIRQLEWSSELTYQNLFSSNSFNSFIVEDMKADNSGNIFMLLSFLGDGSPIVLITNPEGEILGTETESVISLSPDYSPHNGGFALEGETLYAYLWNPDRYSEEKLICYSGKYTLDPLSFEEEKTIIGNPKTESDIPLVEPTSFIVRNQVLYFLDSFSNTIYQIDQNGKLLKSYSSPKSGTGILNGISGDDQGNIYVTSDSKNLISVYNKNLEMISSLGKPAKDNIIPEIGEFTQPYGAIVDSKNYLYVTDLYSTCVQVFDPQRNPYLTIFLENKSSMLTAITIDERGNLVVKDSQEHKIYVLDISQIESKKVVQTNTIKTGIDATYNHDYIDYDSTSLVTNQKNNYLIPSRKNSILFEIDQKGEQVNSYLNSGDSETFYEIVSPRHIIKDMNQNFIIADEWTGKIWKLDADLKVIWEEKLPWFGIQSMWENEQGVIFVADKAHSVLFSMKDLTFDPTKKPNPPPPPPPIKNWIIRMKLGKAEFTINGKPTKLDAPPFRDPKTGRTFAPVRILVETIGGTIVWIAESQKVMIRKDTLEIVLVINSPDATVNGKKVPIDPINEENKSTKVVPKIVSGRVMLPLRFVSEQLGYLVDWIANSEEIILTYPKPEEKLTSNTWGKVYGFNRDDYTIGLFPTKDSGAVAFIHINDYDLKATEKWSGYLKLDKNGNVVSSKLINKNINHAVQLTDGTFVLIGRKNMDYSSFKEFSATWVNEAGEIIKSIDYTLDSKYISFCPFLRVYQQNNVVYMYGEIEDKTRENNEMRKHGIIKIGDKVTVSELPDGWSLYNSKELGILDNDIIIDKELTMSLYDFTGKGVWSRKLMFSDLPDSEDKPHRERFYWQELRNGSMMITIPIEDDDISYHIYLIDKEGNLQWGNNISFGEEFFGVDFGSMEVLDNSDLKIPLYLKRRESRKTCGFLTLDKYGKVKSIQEMNPDITEYSYMVTKGTNQDYWTWGSTQTYATGYSNSLFFHMSGYEDKIPCEIESIIQVSADKIDLQITNIAKPEDIVLTPFDLIITSKPSTISTKPAKVFIKNLCQ